MLPAGKIALWCFLIWYLATVIHHFDPTPAIWLNALGISAIIGVALYLSVDEPGKPPPDRWTTLRLFLMPFCVSSFSQLIKGRGFVLIFPPGPARARGVARRLRAVRDRRCALMQAPRARNPPLPVQSES